MGFKNISMPETLSWGYIGGPGFRTQIVITDSGHEERIQRWQTGRWQWNVTRRHADYEDANELLEFYLNVKGSAFSWRFKDHSDFHSNPDTGTAASATPQLDQYLGDGDGSETTFQLYKNYVYQSASYTYQRVITHPVSGTVQVAVNGTEQISPGWTYEWSVDTATGIITFTTPPPAGQQVTAGFQYEVPCRFGEEVDENIGMEMVAYDVNTIESLPIIEVLDEGDVPETWDPGGSVDYAASADWTLTLSVARHWVVTATAGIFVAFLPEPINYGSGGPFFVMFNDSTLYTYDIQDAGGNPVGTVPVKSGGVMGKLSCGLLDNGDGTKTWFSYS